MTRHWKETPRSQSHKTVTRSGCASTPSRKLTALILTQESRGVASQEAKYYALQVVSSSRPRRAVDTSDALRHCLAA